MSSSRSHCLTKMPRDAVMREMARLNNHNELVSTEAIGAANEVVWKDGIVELMKFPLKERLVSWAEIWNRIWFVVSSV